MKSILKTFIFFLFSSSIYASACYSISNIGNELIVSVTPNSSYTAPFNNWTTANVTIAWDQTLGDDILNSISNRNGFPFAADGTPALSDGMYYQKFGFSSPVPRDMVSGESLEILRITVLHPTIVSGDFQIIEDSPIAGGDASFTNILGEQFVSDGCNLRVNNVPLPLSLTRFESIPRQRFIELVWETENETNFSHFELERSRDGATFRRITSVKGKNQIQGSYSFEDTAILYNIDYIYRLRMIDLDGSYSFSDNVSGRIAGRKSVQVMPNPVADKLNIEFSIPTNINNAQVEIIDAIGKRVLSTVLDIEQGDSNLVLDTEKLSNGIYFVKIIDQEKSQVISNKKFIKQGL